MLGSAEGVLEPLLRQERFKYHLEVSTMLPGRSYLRQVDGGVCGVGARQAYRGGRQATTLPCEWEQGACEHGAWSL